MATTTKKEAHISHSQITEFTRCPRKYHLHYRVGLLAAFCPSGLLFGSAVHEAVALFNQGRLEGKKPSPEELLAAYRACWEKERLPVRLRSRESPASFEATARRLLELCASEQGRSGEVVAVEEPFSIRLSERTPEVKGVIDLVERARDGTDYKTSSSRSEPEADQLVLYREALLKTGFAAGCVVHARYVLLVKGAEPEIILRNVKIGQSDGERLRRLYEAVWRDIKLGCSFPIPGWWCADCQWQRHCDQAQDQTERRGR